MTHDRYGEDRSLFESGDETDPDETPIGVGLSRIDQLRAVLRSVGGSGSDGGGAAPSVDVGGPVDSATSSADPGGPTP